MWKLHVSVSQSEFLFWIICFSDNRHSGRCKVISCWGFDLHFPISPGISLEGMMLKLILPYLATSCKELTHWKRLCCWEGLGAGGEGDDRGGDGWMASPIRCTWVWVNSGCWWWTRRPGLLWFVGSQRIGHNWVTELNWTEWLVMLSIFPCTCSPSVYLLQKKKSILIFWPLKKNWNSWRAILC